MEEGEIIVINGVGGGNVGGVVVLAVGVVW